MPAATIADRQGITCHGPYLQTLAVKAGLAAGCDGIQEDDHRQLSIPGAGPERIEVPFEVAFVLPVVLDLVAGAAQRPDLQ